MKKTGILLIIFFALWFVKSCENKQKKITGEITLSSIYDFEKNTVSGFNFSTLSYVDYPSGMETIPDIILDQFRLLNGTIKPGFGSPNNNNGFALIDQFDSMSESQEFYEDYEQVEAGLNFVASSDTVKLYQVWVLKTASENYVKLNVKDIQVMDNMSGTYVEVVMDYYYQDDGSSIFP